MAPPDAPARPPGEGVLVRAVAATPPQVLLLVSIVSIQLGAAVAVDLFPVLGPVGTAFLRLAISAVLLLVATRRTVAWGARRHAGALLLYGAVLGAMNVCFYGAIARIPLGIAVALEFVGLLGLAAVTSHRRRDFAWIGLAALGILLLTPEIGDTLDPLGVALALAAGLCWAGFTVLSKRIGQVVPGHSGLAIAMAIATLVVLPMNVIVGEITGLQRLDAGLAVAMLAVAILSTAMPLSLEFEALKRMSARTYGILVTLEPAAAAIVGAVLLGQVLGLEGVLAVALVSAAALGVTISDRRDQQLLI